MMCVSPKVIGVKQFRKWRYYTKLGILWARNIRFVEEGANTVNTYFTNLLLTL
jgi:hypothetical protein